MTQLIITRGLPGSGKTTAAKEWLKLDPHRRRVNRDDIRKNIYGAETGILESRDEQEVTHIQEDLARRFLSTGHCVIIDDTNLRLKVARHWAELAADFGATFEIWDFPVDLQTALRQNENRKDTNAYVPPEVIIEKHKRFPYPWGKVEIKREIVLPTPYVPVPGTEKVYLFDIDGTVALHTNRSPYDYSLVSSDTPNIHVVRLLWNLYDDSSDKVIFMSGRDSSCREDTVNWLVKNIFDSPLPYDMSRVRWDLFMRASGDSRRDDIVKLDLFNDHIRDNYDVIGVFDDRKRVVDLWRKLGLTTFAVADGNF